MQCVTSAVRRGQLCSWLVSPARRPRWRTAA